VTVSCAQVASGTSAETAIFGVVRTESHPARVAYIRVSRPDGEFIAELRCAPTGSFHMGIPPGEYRVICLAPRAGRLEQTLDIHRGDQFEVVFDLEPAAAA
jgi:hypothetical protein